MALKMTPMNELPKVKISESLRWSGMTHRGKVRKSNEDAFLCLQFDAREVHYLGKIGDAPLEPTDFVFAVSDGMGGAMAGEFASRIAMEKVGLLLPRAFKQSASGIEAGFEDVMGELFDQIHRALLYLGSSDEDCAGMGATLSLCVFTPGRMYFGHIGDSRIYYLPEAERSIKQISHDDTHVGWLFRQGKINEREARQHPRRNVLQRALGAGNQFVEPQVGVVAYEPGDMFLLCSDGLIEGIYDEQLLEFLRSPEFSQTPLDPAHRLIAAALDRASRDNLTALVVEAL
jgi:serine/threonine protein phosphatase PrpC